ncbi:uncharacterized protein KY384_004235 [Bacidia gigantensis]|uniref:uncharacterized protein n=1 Tax=Bacidia gigantensis TaxID=2732470 RepID=UPI001D042989|nr:uncharacterized protein KY384_004235 [Bacidia gigantensis]KAG8530878.1 hypothetical protein KY384_004235 [Bacidia gigantensis]
MKENQANFSNKWNSSLHFAGADEMHPVPPTFDCHEKIMLGKIDSTVSYHLDVTTTKIAKGTSSFWLPQLSSTFRLMPIRAEQNPDPRWSHSTSSHTVQGSGMQLKANFSVPTVCFAGGPFPLSVGCEYRGSPAGAPQLASLVIQLKGAATTRARPFLTGEKDVKIENEGLIANYPNLAITLAPEPASLLRLNGHLPADALPSFKSFTVCQSYVVSVKYGLRIGSEVIQGQLPNNPLEVLSGIFRLNA